MLPRLRRPATMWLVVLLLVSQVPAQRAGSEVTEADMAASTANPAFVDLPGWKLAFADEFSTDVPRGSFASAASGRYFLYSGSKDTSGNGTHSPEIIAVQGGVLDIAIGTVDGVRKVAALGPLPAGRVSSAGDLPGMRVAFRIRADRMVGYKGVPLLWPKSGNWPWDGEIDFPESNFDGHPYAFMHRQNATVGSDQDWYATPAGTSWQDWHEYVIEWVPGVRAEFFIDGLSIGRSTSRVPNTPMHLVLQFETQMPGAAPSTSVAGHVQIDWLAVWSIATTNTALPAASPNPIATPVPTPVPTAQASPTPAASPTPTATPTATPLSGATPLANPAATPLPPPSGLATPTGRVIAYAETSAQITYSRDWGTARHRLYQAGSARYSATRGAAATFRFTGSSVAWLGPKGPTRGKAAIYVDGKFVRTVDLYASRFEARPQALFTRAWTTVAAHTLKIVVAGTAGRPIVAIDAFNVGR